MRKHRYWRERLREASARLWEQAGALLLEEMRAGPDVAAALRAVRFRLTDDALAMEVRAESRR